MIDPSSPAGLAVLVLLGLVGGVVTIMVGGSSLIVFPGLLALGFGPVTAIATYAVAMFPAGAVGVFADRARRPVLDRRLGWAIGLALAGGVAGSWLLVRTPERALTGLVPVLIGAATLVFAYARTIQTRLAGRDLGDDWGMRLALALAFLYGGYFGAGLGIIVMGLLAAGGMTDFRQANVIKNMTGTLCGAASLAIFIADDHVVWPAAAAIALGGVFGAYAGARLVARMRNESFRAIVVGVGGVMTLVYAVRYWFS
jgi:uncharacterized membrane protein YfcA